MPIEVRGSQSLKRKLQSLSTVARGQIQVRALKAGGLVIQNEAKRLVPRVTSNLARSIHIGGEAQEGSVIQMTGEPVPEPEVSATSAAIYVGTDVEYARRVEHGFMDTDALGRSYHQPAQPYMRPAVDTTRAEVRQEVAEALRDLIRAAIP